MRDTAPHRTFVIDGRPLFGGSAVRGIGSYVRQLLGGLADIGAADEVGVLVPSGAVFPDDIAAWRDHIAGQVPVLKRRIQPIADHLLVMRELRRIRPRLFHATEWAQPLRSAVPVVVTVHDLIPFIYPKLYPWMRRERALAFRLLRRAQAVITVSQQTADDTVRMAHVSRDRVHVIHHGVAPAFRPAGADQVAETRRRYGITSPYVLAVGTQDPRKRVGLLMDALSQVDAGLVPVLVLAGDQGVYADACRRAAARFGVTSRVVLTGHVPGRDLVSLYTGTRSLLTTSSYEGFGLPLLEAMACGTPSIACRNSALVEVSGDAGVLVDDGDADALAAAVTRLAANTRERADVVARGIAHASTFSWRRTAEQTLDVYRSVVGETSR
jgi:glycosyltransferase involved in cell wall biosynthesis